MSCCACAGVRLARAPAVDSRRLPRTPRQLMHTYLYPCRGLRRPITWSNLPVGAPLVVASANSTPLVDATLQA